MPHRWVLVAPLLALVFGGCGAKNDLSLGKVTGNVTYRGELVRQGTVTFLPDESKGTRGPSALGVIGKDGVYVMTTEQSGDGALVGSHKVGVLALGTTPVTGGQSADGGEQDEVKAYLARKSATVKSSVQTGKKKADSSTYRDPSGKVFPILVPENITRPTESGILVKVEPGSNTLNIAIQENGTALVGK